VSVQSVMSNLGCYAKGRNEGGLGSVRMRSGLPNEKELFDAEEVAEYLGVERSTVQRWCRSGHLRCIKIGKAWRIRRDALEDFLKQSENTANSA
jgi:excisionase family DNA binding protein